MKGDLTNWKVGCIEIFLKGLKFKWYFQQALSAAFENPSNYANDDLGKVEELMQVLKSFLKEFGDRTHVTWIKQTERSTSEILNKYFCRIFVVYVQFSFLEIPDSIFKQETKKNRDGRHKERVTDNLFWKINIREYSQRQACLSFDDKNSIALFSAHGGRGSNLINIQLLGYYHPK